MFKICYSYIPIFPGNPVNPLSPGKPSIPGTPERPSITYLVIIKENIIIS